MQEGPQVQALDDLIEIHPVNLRDDLGFGALLGKQGQEKVLLIHSRQSDEGLAFPDSFFH